MTKVRREIASKLPSALRSRLRSTYARIAHFGFRFRCPFCSSRVRSFLAFGLPFPVLREKRVVGSGIRENALCPVCFAIDRHRLIYLYLKNKTTIFSQPTKLLHVAPEPRIAELLLAATNVDYLSADLCPEGVMVQMDITAIQYPDNNFDAIICNHVLGNIGDDRLAFKEILRTLKPGGWAILQVPISKTLDRTYEDFSITTEAGREQAFGEAHQIRIYAADFKDRLESAGFQVDVFNWTDEPEAFGGKSNLYALNPDESVYRVRKPG